MNANDNEILTTTTTTTELPRTLPALSYELFVSLEALQVKLRRMGRTVTTDNLSDDDLKAIVMDYAVVSGRRTPETVEAARRLLMAMGVEVPTDTEVWLGPRPKRSATPATPRPSIAPEPAPAPPSPEPAPMPAPAPTPAPAPVATPAPESRIVRFFRSDGLLFVVFMGAMVWQVLNTTEVVMWADQESSYFNALLYAGSIQFTALLMTLHRGGRIYLLIFAILEYGVNIIHYRPWDTKDAGVDVWVIDNLLSFAIAFSIYSYSEIFTSKRRQ